MMRKPVILFALLIVSILLYVILVSLGDFSNQVAYYLLITGTLFAIYLILVILTLRTKNNLPLHWTWFMVFALLSRLVLILASPKLSHEINRYFWLEDSILIVKMILLVIETTLIFILGELLQHFSLNINRLIIFLYNPLLVIETYYNGHLEIMAAMFVWLAIFAFYKQKDRLTFAGIIMSVVAKPFLLITAIPFLYNRFWRKFFLLILICIVILLIFGGHAWILLTGFLPTQESGILPGAIFKSITSVIDMLDLPAGKIILPTWLTIYVNNVFYYSIIAFLTVIIIAFDQMRKLKVTANYRSINYLQASFVLTGSGILLLPDLSPCYLIPIIPFLLFLPNWSWLGFTALLQLTYYIMKEYVIKWPDSQWILLAIYLPFYILLIWEHLDRRQIKGWFLGGY